MRSVLPLPVTATTDFLAPDILNKCGRAVPAVPYAPPQDPDDRLRSDRHASTVPASAPHHLITATRGEPINDGCPLLGPKQTCAGRPGTSPFDLGRVKTCAHEERAELFSLLSCLDNR